MSRRFVTEIVTAMAFGLSLLATIASFAFVITLGVLYALRTFGVL